MNKITPQSLELTSPSQVKPKPKGSKVLLILLITLYAAIQLALAGLAFYSFIFAIQESNRGADEKAAGKFQTVEMYYTKNNTKKLGYFIANTQGNLSLTNKTYSYDEYNLKDSPLRLCYLYSVPSLVLDTEAGLIDPTALNSVKLVLAMLIFLDIFDSFKGVLPKLSAYILSKVPDSTWECLRKACCIPKKVPIEAKEPTKSQKACMKIMVLLMVASPRYLSLHFTGEDYSNCVGFVDTDPFNQIIKGYFYPAANANTIQTWDTDSSDTAFRIYQAYVVIFFVNIGFWVCVPWLPNEPWHSKCVKASLIITMLLQIFGLGYFIVNYWLLAAQIQNNVRSILSLLYIGRDGLNIIILGLFDFMMKKWQNLTDLFAATSAAAGGMTGGSLLDDAKNMVQSKMDDIANNVQGDLEYAADKVDGKIQEEQKKQEDEEKKEKEQTQKTGVTHPGDEFNKLIE